MIRNWRTLLPLLLGTAFALLFVLSLGTEFVPLSQQRVQAKDGQLDLRDWSFSEEGTVFLNGEWNLVWEEYLNPNSWEEHVPSGQIVFPGDWRGLSYQGEKLPGQGFATFHLRLILPLSPPALSLRIPEFLTAYKLFANGKLLCQNGTPGQDAAHSQAHFEPQLVSLPGDTSLIDLVIHGANFRFFRGGLVAPISLDQGNVLRHRETTHSRNAGIILGILLLAGIILLRMFYFRRQDQYYLYLGAFCVLGAIHLLFMDMRFLYVLGGPDWWAFSFRVEVLTGSAGQAFIYLFAYSFFPSLIPKVVVRPLVAYICLAALAVLLLPLEIATVLEWISPSMLVLTVVATSAIFFYALRENAPGAKIFIPPLLLSLGLVAIDLLSGNLQMTEGLNNLHFAWLFVVLGISATVSQRAANSFNQVISLSSELQQANDALEKHNEALEQEVASRTAQWVASEEKNRALEMAQKRRDMENLSASNLMIQRNTDLLIDELKAMQKDSNTNYPLAIRQLILRLQAQSGTSDRILQMQRQVATINEAFYERLRTEYPQLTKGERELCSFIKLNLSNKDIAALRNSTVGTINVARHRLRKKLGLERRAELEAFVQQL